MELIYAAVFAFIMTTIMGLYLSWRVLQNKDRPKRIIIIHGFLTMIGFVILYSYYPESMATIFYFAIATCFGLVLLYQDIKGVEFTKWLCYAHAIFTLGGCIYLIELVLGICCVV